MLNIAINLRKKYNGISELLDLTQQMEDCISRNDMVSFNMLLTMRTDVLLEIEKIDENREQLLSKLEPQKAQRAKYYMQKDAIIPDDIPAEDLKIYSTFMDCKSVAAKLISIDKMLSKKICGDKSFYKK
jgi:FlgN protein.